MEEGKEVKKECKVLECEEICLNLPRMEKQTIDTYRLTSLEEPSDEILSQLMCEAALTARERAAEAHRRYFEQLSTEIAQKRQQWSALSF